LPPSRYPSQLYGVRRCKLTRPRKDLQLRRIFKALEYETSTLWTRPRISRTIINKIRLQHSTIPKASFPHQLTAPQAPHDASFSYRYWSEVPSSQLVDKLTVASLNTQLARTTFNPSESGPDHPRLDVPDYGAATQAWR
jgi:hypothetical protein